MEHVDPERNSGGAQHLEPHRHIRLVAHGVEPGDDGHGNAKHHDDREQGFVPRLLLAAGLARDALAHELRDRGGR